MLNLIQSHREIKARIQRATEIGKRTREEVRNSLAQLDGEGKWFLRLIAEDESDADGHCADNLCNRDMR